MIYGKMYYYIQHIRAFVPIAPKHRCTANRVQKPKGEYRQDNTCWKKQFIVRHSASP